MSVPLPRRVYIFRHGQTDWNVQERFQGHIDVPLNDVGRGQARALIEPLRTAGVGAILSSDLARARETGTIVARALGLPTFEEARLREAHLGDAQGLTREEIEARFGAEVTARWRSNHLTDADISYPGGETGTQIMARVFAALEAFLAAHPGFAAIGVATHGGVIRRVMQKILPPGSPTVAIPNGVLYALEYADGNWTRIHSERFSGRMPVPDSG